MTTATSSGAAATRPRLISAEELLAHDHWPRDRLLTYQRGRLRELIEHAVSSSAYYREALGRDALDSGVHLEDLPVLPKAMLMEQFDRVLADPRLRLDLLTVTTPPSEIIESLNRDQPDVLFTVPSLAGALAEQQLAGHLAITPQQIVLSGEVLSDEVTGRIAEAWAIEPFQVYASTEALMLATESPG